MIVESQPQLFAYLSAPNTGLHNAVLGVFGQAREQFAVHLRPEDVAFELRRTLSMSAGSAGAAVPAGPGTGTCSAPPASPLIKTESSNCGAPEAGNRRKPGAHFPAPPTAPATRSTARVMTRGWPGPGTGTSPEKKTQAKTAARLSET